MAVYLLALCTSTLFITNTYGVCPSVEECVDSSSGTYDCSNYTNEELQEWKSKYETMVSVGSWIYPQASSNLQHFLDGSGNLVEMSKEFLLDYSAVTNRIDANIHTIICGSYVILILKYNMILAQITHNIYIQYRKMVSQKQEVVFLVEVVN